MLQNPQLIKFQVSVFRCQDLKKKADRLESYKAGKLEGFKARKFSGFLASWLSSLPAFKL